MHDPLHKEGKGSSSLVGSLTIEYIHISRKINSNRLYGCFKINLNQQKWWCIHEMSRKTCLLVSPEKRTMLQLLYQRIKYLMLTSMLQFVFLYNHDSMHLLDFMENNNSEFFTNLSRSICPYFLDLFLSLSISLLAMYLRLYDPFKNILDVVKTIFVFFAKDTPIIFNFVWKFTIFHVTPYNTILTVTVLLLLYHKIRSIAPFTESLAFLVLNFGTMCDYPGVAIAVSFHMPRLLRLVSLHGLGRYMPQRYYIRNSLQPHYCRGKYRYIFVHIMIW